MYLLLRTEMGEVYKGRVPLCGQTFLWRMVHNLLPTQARLFRLKMRNAPTHNCPLCEAIEPADNIHSLLTCSFNSEVSRWLMTLLHVHLPDVQPKQVVLLDLGAVDESLELPLVWLIANTLSLVWESRREKTKPTLHKVRSTLEAKINILRKTRFKNATALLVAFPIFSLT